jgi:hypothetical protein
MTKIPDTWREKISRNTDMLRLVYAIVRKNKTLPLYRRLASVKLRKLSPIDPPKCKQQNYAKTAT